MTYEEFHVKPNFYHQDALEYLFYKDYNLSIDGYHQKIFEKYENENYSLDIHEKISIYKSIMDDDKESFIKFIEDELFDKDKILINEFYPESEDELSLLELCCYHGSVGCFKLLRTKFKSEITLKCLQFSFLGGNPEIIHECLKEQDPDENCMNYAIVSNNIDFISFLMNEYDIDINLEICGEYLNLQAFLMNLDITKDFRKSFIYSPPFSLLSLVEYLFSYCDDVNAPDSDGMRALHFAAIYNCKSIAEFLISNGADVNAINDSGSTALVHPSFVDNKEIIELLLSHGADINDKNENEQTALLNAVERNYKDLVEFLILHGANIGCPKVRLAQCSI
ncbi:hypothetical protein TVAG_161770 [Trichomonas vaginalis G3]|uniref:DUF3447 domain-containing protein n=1 Tax=Trichomonas vaginalis (strain ATCC PRA-98 / G3) TaxID=412133 RepID=A2EUQ0_TRIV3|nr:hypothetical protein TVAG_161770 [Trichomonas vaginalis G3]|eukprot:XP_001315861.1 hypothetical protein [Trichomonas vaginalis G3]